MTGANEVFIIDEDTKNKLVSEDRKSIEIIKPFWRGQDVKRWNSGWNNTWMIFTRRGIDLDKYPAIKNYLTQHRSRIEPRPIDVDKSTWQGRKNGSYKWYEIQDAVDYYELFLQPKIIYKEIQFHPEYSYDDSGYLANNKVFIIPSSDLYLLAVLNSPLMWWHNWRYLPHMKDDALSPSGYLMGDLPIAPPDNKLRAEVEAIASRSIELTNSTSPLVRI